MRVTAISMAAPLFPTRSAGARGPIYESIPGRITAITTAVRWQGLPRIPNQTGDPPRRARGIDASRLTEEPRPRRRRLYRRAPMAWIDPYYRIRFGRVEFVRGQW